MDVAREAFGPDTVDFYTIATSRQTKGRGRLGRVWTTLPDHSLAFTVCVKDPTAEQLPLVTALSIAEGLQDVAKESFDIKWPNDVLKGGLKVAGILTEKHQRGFLVGVGVNLTKPENIPADFPGGFALKGPQPPQQVLETLLAALQARVNQLRAQGWGALAVAYTQKCITLGQTVHWHTGKKVVEGQALGLDSSGALELKTDEGIRLVTGGEIIAQAL